jgi:hypothetical protein
MYTPPLLVVLHSLGLQWFLSVRVCRDYCMQWSNVCSTLPSGRCRAGLPPPCSESHPLLGASAAALTVSALPDSCTLAVSAAANAVRVNVYNANYKGTAVGSLVNKAGSVDLQKYMVKGANRVVLTLLNNRCACPAAESFLTMWR